MFKILSYARARVDGLVNDNAAVSTISCILEQSQLWCVSLSFFFFLRNWLWCCSDWSSVANNSVLCVVAPPVPGKVSRSNKSELVLVLVRCPFLSQACAWYRATSCHGITSSSQWAWPPSWKTPACRARAIGAREESRQRHYQGRPEDCLIKGSIAIQWPSLPSDVAR